MQAEVMYRKSTLMSTHQNLPAPQSGMHRVKVEPRDTRETIHSGHFMVSDFEAEAQDDEDELAVPVPDEEAAKMPIAPPPAVVALEKFVPNSTTDKNSQQLSIETSLNKLFQCMSLAYRQKLTSPKWNRFKGIRLRWKDKIRLNNVIWRCWHMQFILKQSTLVCQFASPLDVDTHNKPEAVVLEGKYWKRKLAAVTAEYKKWRMFYRNKILGWTSKDGTDMLASMDMLDWGNEMGNAGGFSVGAGSTYGAIGGMAGGTSVHSMMVDEDYMELMTDTLFSTISSNQPIYFPDPREIARGASLADFIQPSLGPLQPNLDDFMDTLEPLHEFLNSKLPPVPEEDDMFRSGPLNTNYSELDLMAPMSQAISPTPVPNVPNPETSSDPQSMQTDEPVNLQNPQYASKLFPQDSTGVFRDNMTVNQNFSPIQQNYEAANSIRDKARQSRSPLRSNRGAQQMRPTYQSNPFQNLQFAQNTQISTVPRTYSLDIQTPQLAPSSGQIPLAEQPPNQNATMTLIGSTQNYAPNTSQQQRPIKPAAAIKSYKIAPQQLQSYKFPSPVQFGDQQCKNLIKTLTVPPVVAVTTTQSVQPNILLQCKPTGIDLTAPAQHPTKLLPRPAVLPGEKEEVFAVPKYQMKARNRSRSSSSLIAPRLHPPPLVSAVSDPALNLNHNVLLAHLLTNNTSNLYTVSTGPDKSGTNPTLGVKHILPMLTPVPTQIQTTNIATPITVQTMHATSLDQSQSQVMPQQTVVATLLNSNPNSPKDSSSAHSPSALSLSPMHSPMSIGSPLSPSRSFIKGDSERGHYKEQRRVGHIHAEQKRRYNIKNGFDMLHSLIPQLSQNPNAKLSKAAMLQKGADYIRQLRSDRNQLKEEMDSLRHQIECLNTSISNCQSMLPATGAPVSRHRTTKMKEMFDDYVRTRTRENWKFWIFAIILEPLLASFNTSVSTANLEELYRSTVLWVEQYCSLVDLRPAVLNSLKYLCTATDILSNPARLPEEALAAVNQPNEQRKST